MISKDDIEFIFISTLNSTFKIYKILQEVDEDEIGNYLNNFF